MVDFTIKSRHTVGDEVVRVVWQLYAEQDGFYLRRDGNAIFPPDARPDNSLSDVDLVVLINQIEWLTETRAAFNAEFTARMAAGNLDRVPGAPPPPPPPPPPPMSNVPRFITFRQLVLALMAAEWLTTEEAIDVAENRSRPPQFEAVIASLPPNEAAAARITWATMTTILRNDPLLSALVLAGQATDEQIDDLFIAASYF